MIKYRFTWGNECVVILIQFVYFFIAYWVFNFFNWQTGDWFEWSQVTLPPTYWGHGQVTAGFVAFCCNAIEQFFTIVAGIILGSFLLQGIIEENKATLGQRIASQDLHGEVSGGDGPNIFVSAVHFMRHRRGIMLKRLVIVIVCGLLNFLGVQGVQSLQNTVAVPHRHVDVNSSYPDVSRLFTSADNMTSDQKAYEMFITDRLAYQPLPFFNMLAMNLTMEDDGVMSLPAANCWARNVDNMTVAVNGLCEGTTIKSTPYLGDITVGNYEARQQDIPAAYYTLNTTYGIDGNGEKMTGGFLIPLPLTGDGAMYVLSSNLTDAANSSSWWFVIGLVAPLTPNMTTDAELSDLTTIKESEVNATTYTKFSAPNTSRFKDGWHVIVDSTGNRNNRSMWFGNCTLSFWREHTIEFSPRNKRIANDTADLPSVTVSNFPNWLYPQLVAVDGDMLAAWSGLGYNNLNTTFDQRLAEKLTSHLFHSIFSTWRNGTLGMEGRISNINVSYWFTWEKIENCQQVYLWPYLLVALWMVPMLLYNSCDLVRSRSERHARSVIRDQCLTTEGLIHVYDMYYGKAKTLDPLPQYAKRHSLMDRYDDIDTEFRKLGDEVTWGAPPYDYTPYRPAMTTVYEPLSPDISTVYPADPPMPPLSPTCSYSSTHHNQSPPMLSTPAPHLSPDNSPSWPMGFRSHRSHSDRNLREPLLHDDLSASPDPDPYAIPLSPYGRGH